MISLLRGGKLADKIFNKYNITKEEREEVKNEIASGGGEGTTNKNKYYEIKSDADESLIPLLLMPITEVMYKYNHREDGRFINKCSSGRLLADYNVSGATIIVFAFIDNVENFYISGIEFKNYKEYFNMFKDEFGIEFEDLFKEIDKTTYDEMFDYYVSNINS